MKSKRYTDYFRRVNYWLNGLEELTSCWKATKETGVIYTEKERQELNEAECKFYEAKQIFTSIWARRIGSAVVQEVRSGE